MRPPNIALVGRMGSGKTTLAELLTLRGYLRISHADGLKQIAAAAYGVFDKTDKVIVTRPTKRGGDRELTGREVYQQLGQKVKEFDRDFWLNITIRRSLLNPDQPIVNDDTRFIFEATALRSLGFRIVRINVPLAIRLQRLTILYGRPPTKGEQYHPSEVEIDDIEADLELDGTLEPWMLAESLLDLTSPL